MNPEAMIKKAHAANFIENNGKVLRGINMLRIDFNKLSSIRSALGLDADDFADSVNYLIESEYIRIRHVDTQKPVELADYPMDEIEGKLTAKGIQLLAGDYSVSYAAGTQRSDTQKLDDTIQLYLADLIKAVGWI